jgi:hypothetical protein
LLGFILLLILPAAARYSARCSSSFVPRSPTGDVSDLDTQLQLLHGCQIAIESFHDYDCAEEVRKLNISCSWFPPHGDVTPQVYLDMFEDDRLVAAGKHFIHLIEINSSLIRPVFGDLAPFGRAITSKA